MSDRLYPVNDALVKRVSLEIGLRKVHGVCPATEPEQGMPYQHTCLSHNGHNDTTHTCCCGKEWPQTK